MTEKISATQEGDESSKTATQLNEFWSDQGVPAGVELTKEHKFTLLTAFFHGRLQPLTSRKDERERNERVREFQTWLPFSKGETNMAMDGATTRITKAHHTKNGPPNRAVQETYKTMVGYLQNTYDQMDSLESVLVEQEEGDPAIDIVALRDALINNQGLQSLFANYFYHKEGLDVYGEKRNKKRKGFFHGSIIAAAQNGGDNLLLAMYEHINAHSLARKEYWEGEIKEVQKLNFVKDILADPKFTPPSAYRRRDHSIENEQMQQDEGAGTEVGKLVIEKSFIEAMPKKVYDENLQKYANVTQEIDRLVEQGIMTIEQAEKARLGGATAIRDPEGNIIGINPRDEVFGYPPPSAIIKRSYRGPETGPSDKRVEQDF